MPSRVLDGACYSVNPFFGAINPLRYAMFSSLQFIGRLKHCLQHHGMTQAASHDGKVYDTYCPASSVNSLGSLKEYNAAQSMSRRGSFTTSKARGYGRSENRRAGLHPQGSSALRRDHHAWLESRCTLPFHPCYSIRSNIQHSAQQARHSSAQKFT